MDWWTTVAAMPPPIQMFLAGCLGAIAAELMRFYRVKQIVRRPVPWYMAVTVSLGQIVLAGLYAAWILQVTTAQVAFSTGLTLPYLLAGALGQPVDESRASRGSGR